METIDLIRKRVILQKDLIYFDYTASGLAYKDIEDEISEILKTYANTHSLIGNNASKTSKYYEDARVNLKKSLKIDERFYLISCGFGSSAAIMLFQKILGIYLPPATKKLLNLDFANYKDLPIVVVGPYEHHSNDISFKQCACQTYRAKLNFEGSIDFEDLTWFLKKNSHRRIIASFSAASNVTGVKTDYKKLYKLIKRFNGVLALDASSLSPYENLDPNYYDACFISSHKLLGGVGGSGILLIKKELCKDQDPIFAGGGTVEYVSRKDEVFTQNYEQLQEAGTPGILALIRASLAFKLRDEIGLEFINQKDEELKIRFETGLRNIKNIKTYHPKIKDRLPIFAFNISGISPFEVSKILSDKYGIQSRAGCACAGPYGHEILNLKDGSSSLKPGFVRISLHFTHKLEEIDYLLNALKEISLT